MSADPRFRKQFERFDRAVRELNGAIFELAQEIEKPEAAAPDDATKTLFACPTCGCTDIEFSMWVNANTHEVMSEDGSDLWCPQCEEHHKTSIVTMTACPFDPARVLPPEAVQ